MPKLEEALLSEVKDGIRLRERLTALEAQNTTLKAAAAKVCEGFDKGIFVRSTDGDGASDWAVKLFPYLAALGKLQEALGSTHD